MDTVLSVKIQLTNLENKTWINQNGCDSFELKLEN